jgi:hypothetical protein
MAARRTTGLICAALVAAFIVTGCSAGSSDNRSASSAGGASGLSAPQQDVPEKAAPNAAAPGQAAAGQGKDQAAEAPDLSVDQRTIVYTGSITIRVGDVNVAAARATAIVTGAGGFVGGDKRDINGKSSDATMELRVPAEKFQSVVDQLAKQLGTEEQRGISTEDVTEQTVDLDARIAVQQARVDSGRRLLAQAKTLNDLVMLEREVASRESDLASLQAKKRRLADLTALSTITVVLLDPGAQAAPTKDDNPPGFLAGLQGGWKALLASLGVVLTVLGALLPWLIAIGLPLWAVLYVYRRYFRRPRPASMPALAAAGGAPLPGFPGPYGPHPAAAPPFRSQPPAAGAQPPTAGSQSPTGHPQPSTADPQSSTAHLQPSTTGPQPPMTGPGTPVARPAPENAADPSGAPATVSSQDIAERPDGEADPKPRRIAEGHSGDGEPGDSSTEDGGEEQAPPAR